MSQHFVNIFAFAFVPLCNNCQNSRLMFYVIDTESFAFCLQNTSHLQRIGLQTIALLITRYILYGNSNCHIYVVL